MRLVADPRDQRAAVRQRRAAASASSPAIVCGDGRAPARRARRGCPRRVATRSGAPRRARRERRPGRRAAARPSSPAPGAERAHPAALRRIGPWSAIWAGSAGSRRPRRSSSSRSTSVGPGLRLERDDQQILGREIAGAADHRRSRGNGRPGSTSPLKPVAPTDSACAAAVAAGADPAAVRRAAAAAPRRRRGRRRSGRRPAWR